MKRLDGKVAIITGGAGGIGAATGQLFCEEGARVALVDVEGSPLSEVAATLRQRVPGAVVQEIRADVGAEASESCERSVRLMALRKPIKSTGLSKLLTFGSVLPGARLPVWTMSMM